jgi:hypothetical protein
MVCMTCVAGSLTLHRSAITVLGTPHNAIIGGQHFQSHLL